MRCFWLLCLSLSLYAQTVDVSKIGTGTVSLAGQWKFHPGDDPRWADPNVDDSNWKLVKAPQSLQKQGYPNFSGYGWYRLMLYCDPRTAPPELRLALSEISDVGAFFANGVQFGQFGAFPPEARFFLPRPMSFPIASSRWRDGRLLLAVRIWADPQIGNFRRSLADITSIDPIPLTVGSQTAIQNLVDARKRGRELNRLPTMLIKCAGLILAFYLLGLYFTESRRPEYLWLGLAFVCDALTWLLGYWIAPDTFLLSVYAFLSLGYLLTPFLLTTMILGIWSVFDVPASRWLKGFIYFIFVYYLASSVAVEFGFLALWKKYNVLQFLVVPLNICIILSFLLRRIWSTSGELRWFALSFLPSFAVGFVSFAAYSIPVIGRHVNIPLTGLLFATTGIFTVVAVGFLLMRRAGRARAEQERLHSEMAAARQVQRLMLPAQCVDAPHVHIDTAYLPSQEVGGDFYQIATDSDGSVLLIIGDVSGKGLQAALTMSLIVGLWQELVSCVESPREILCRFNEHLKQRLSGGFVTCLCARLKPDGQLTIANAGHLAPYLNGKELTTLNGLPLGIVEESDYSESHFLLAPTDTLVLISDGVVEARDRSHSFYGFERLQQALTEHPGADAIARRAQQFGQEDDITVIALSRRAVAAESTANQTAFAV